MSVSIPYSIATNAYVIEDSEDIPQMITDIAQGLNGSLGNVFKSYERHLKIEFRTQSSLQTFTSSLVTSKGVLTYDGKNYLVRSMNFIEQFISPEPVYTYGVDLYRDDYS